MGEGQDATGHSFRPHVSVKDAAKHLGTTADPIRKLAQRGNIAHDKDADGRVWIVPDTDRTHDMSATGERQDNDMTVIRRYSCLRCAAVSRTSGSSSKPNVRPTPNGGGYSLL